MNNKQQFVCNELVCRIGAMKCSDEFRPMYEQERGELVGGELEHVVNWSVVNWSLEHGELERNKMKHDELKQ